MTRPRVLVACEFSGIVRDAFIARGADAISCDLLPSERPGPHVQGRVEDLLGEGGDLLIAFPPCTYLCVAGRRWMQERLVEMFEALDFVRLLLDAPFDRIALENPIGVISTEICKPAQIIQPWWFGHPETKSTCLWLKRLPKLVPTNIVEPLVWGSRRKGSRVDSLSPSPDRWKERSRTLQGVADAMADQWL